MGFLDRLQGRVDRRHISQAVIAVVGVGSVGSHIAWELARLVPRRLIVVDGEDYEEHNRVRHILPRRYVGMNKAVSLAAHIQAEIPGIGDVRAIPSHVTRGTTDLQLRRDVLAGASAVVIATDDLQVQRRLALLTRQHAIPALVPGIAESGERGEVFVSLDADHPCLVCFDGFRSSDRQVRAAAMAGPDILPTVVVCWRICVGLLGAGRSEELLFQPSRPDGNVPQLFRAFRPGDPENGAADDGRTEVAWRPDCPGCGGRGLGLADIPKLRWELGLEDALRRASRAARSWLRSSRRIDERKGEFAMRHVMRTLGALVVLTLLLPTITELSRQVLPLLVTLFVCCFIYTRFTGSKS